MSTSLKPYLDSVREELQRSLCLTYFPSPVVERHNKPEVETRESNESLLEPILISRNQNEAVLIEPSINSARISLRIKKSDELEVLLAHKFTGFMMQRAENLSILRRKPVEGYDLSFLISFEHCLNSSPVDLAECVVIFLEEIDRELSQMKIGVNSRARLAAETFLQGLL